MHIDTVHYLVLSAVLFSIGAYGVLARKNLLVILMCLELMLNAVNLSFIAFSSHLMDMTGHVFMLMNLAVAATEVAVGLAIVVAVYSYRENLNIDLMNISKG